jgi:hypothetical protein
VSYGITSIGEDAVLNAENLTTAVLPDSLTEISSGAFMSGDPRVGYVHGLTNVTIPSRVTKLGSGAFWGSAIESLTIPASVTEIGKYLCRECTHLMSVRINSNLIGAYMFTSCENLKSFSVSSKLQKIGECIFTYCPKLTQIDFDGTVSQWSNIPKGSNWDGLSGLDSSKSGLTKIQCSDGYLEYKNSAWVEVKS